MDIITDNILRNLPVLLGLIAMFELLASSEAPDAVGTGTDAGTAAHPL